MPFTVIAGDVIFFVIAEGFTLGVRINSRRSLASAPEDHDAMMKDMPGMTGMAM